MNINPKYDIGGSVVLRDFLGKFLRYLHGTYSQVGKKVYEAIAEDQSSKFDFVLEIQRIILQVTCEIFLQISNS